jgi:hypothetical protein
MADVSTKLLGQFVDCLEHQVLAGPAEPAETTESEAPETAAPANAAESAVEPLTESVTAVADDVDQAAAKSAGTDEAPATTGMPAESAGAVPARAVRKIDSPEAEPVDLLDTAGAPVAKRAVPLVLGVVALVWLIRLFVKRRRRKA